MTEPHNDQAALLPVLLFPFNEQDQARARIEALRTKRWFHLIGELRCSRCHELASIPTGYRDVWQCDDCEWVNERVWGRLSAPGQRVFAEYLGVRIY